MLVDVYFPFYLASILSTFSPDGNTWYLLLRVVGFLGLLAAGAFFLSKFKKKQILSSGFSKEGKIIVADSCSLGSKQFLVVAQCGVERHLIGVSPGQISHLAKLSSPDQHVTKEELQE